MAVQWHNRKNRQILASILWQIRGFAEQKVEWNNGTKLILRASLRKIKAPKLGISEEGKTDPARKRDHVIPVDVIALILRQEAEPSEERVMALLDQLLFVAVISRREHDEVLREFKKTMPTTWTHLSEDPSNHNARYAAAGICLDTEVVMAAADPPRDGSPTQPAKKRGKLKLSLFREFADVHDELQGEVEKIDKVSVPSTFGSSTSQVRRGYAIICLEDKKLLDAFIDEHWSRGREPGGQTYMKRCRDDALRHRQGNA